MSSDRVIFKGFWIAIILGVILASLFYIGLRAAKQEYIPDFVSQPTLTESQMRKVGEAVTVYTKKHTRRPGTLEAMVKQGLLSPADLFDAERKEIPAIDKTTGRFTITPDVIYFPALQPGDPADCVLLCTVMVKHEDDPFLVIYNDGRFDTLTSRELVEALNRTYGQIGKKCRACNSVAREK